MQVLRCNSEPRSSAPLGVSLRGQRTGKKVNERKKRPLLRAGAAGRGKAEGLCYTIAKPSASDTLTRFFFLVFFLLYPLLRSRYPVVLQRLSELRQHARDESGTYRK